MLRWWRLGSVFKKLRVFFIFVFSPERETHCFVCQSGRAFLFPMSSFKTPLEFLSRSTISQGLKIASNLAKEHIQPQN